MQDKQSIFDELVSQPLAELLSFVHSVEILPLVSDGVLLIVSAFWAWLFVYVLILNKEALGLKKWLEKNCELPSLKVAVVFLFAFSLLSFFHEPVLSYFLNNPLIVAALLGFPILIKRLSVMQEQAEKSQRLVEIGQQQTRFNQYSEGKKLLFSQQLSSRMEGIEALWQFATTYPKEEYQIVMETFSQFIKHPPLYELDEKRNKQFFEKTPAGKRDDIREILRHIGKERMAGVEHYTIDLSNADLKGAILKEAHLEGARLEGARLEGARLDSANLKGAVLLEAHLERAQLQDANLEGAILTGANLERAFLYRANLKGALLVGTNLEGAESRDANLEGAHLRNANLEGARLASANLKEVDFLNAKLGGALLVGANLEESHFFMVHLTLAIINNANFTDATYLTQEQINECVFITDYSDSNQPPTLPNGIEHTYQRMSISEWQDKSGRKF